MTTQQRTLASLKEALQQPFAPETIQFLPKDIHQENGKTVCLALPYANKRVYEDRLNELVYGEWSSPYTPPYAQGNKLIIPATVVILGVAHTDYGEAFMTTPGKNGNPREDENTATEAYSQAFRRACAKFLLGRYLYDLPKHKLPYDPKTRQIAISKAERIAWVEKLYLEHGLALRSSFTAQRPVVVQTPATAQGVAPLATTATPVISAIWFDAFIGDCDASCNYNSLHCPTRCSNYCQGVPGNNATHGISARYLPRLGCGPGGARRRAHPGNLYFLSGARAGNALRHAAQGIDPTPP